MLPSDITVLVQGPTGIGKSHIAAQNAKHFGLPLIDCRLSTYQEGDMIGMPNHAVMADEDVTVFNLPSWYIKACREPCFLLLDELNRALPGVMQSAFQLVLDRQLGADKNGNAIKLHPGTRMMACINAGSEYEVNDIDPALYRRFWVTTLTPDLPSWVAWAIKNNIDPLLIDFLQQNPDHFFVDPGDTKTTGTVLPGPASWDRLNYALNYTKMGPSELAGTVAPRGFLAITHGFVGHEAGNAFANFIKTYDRALVAEDVLDSFDKKVKPILIKMSALEKAALVKKCTTHCVTNNWNRKQATNLSKFIIELPGELKVDMWNGVTQSKNVNNIRFVSKHCKNHVVDHIQIARDTQGKS